MVDYWRIVQELRDERSGRQIAALKLGGRNLISDIKKIIEPLGWLDKSLPPPSTEDVERVLVKPVTVPIQVSKLEPYRTLVEAWVKDGHTPHQIYLALKRKDFGGSVGSVKRFIKRLGKHESKAFVQLHFDAGDAVQVDFGSGPLLVNPRTGKEVRSHIFVMTLCHSRHMYAEIVWDQKVETWLRCHRNAFEFFGGVTHRVIVDNLKSAITRACHRDPEAQRSYAELAKAYGFTIVPCRPRTPRHKGRVERGVGYVKGNFVPLRHFRTIEDANQQLLEWVLEEAGNRIHGTTHERPLTAFAERERCSLQPLPTPRPELVTWCKAKLVSNCHLTVDSSFYSAPYQYMEQELDVRLRENMVEIYRDHQLLCMHPRATTRRTWRTNDEHYPPEKVAYMQKTPQWCLRRAQDIGENCHFFIELLFADRVLDRLSAAHGVLGLAEKFGANRLESACARAIEHDTIEYRTVHRILKNGLDQAPGSDLNPQLQLPFLIAPRFGRDIGQMLMEEITDAYPREDVTSA